MHEEVIISHRGARYEIGRGTGFYGIWPAGGTQAQPLEWWPENPEGWQAAWSRFTEIEARRSIVPVSQQAAPADQQPGLVASRRGRGVVAAALLAIGVAVGIAGLFPGYFGSVGLIRQSAEVVPHAIYLAAWAAAAVLILLGGARQRTGALLAAGTSIVTSGLFLADAGTAITGGAHLFGTGLMLSLIGWLGCAAGSALALWLSPTGAPGRPRGLETTLTLTLAAVAALGTAIAFAPSWDSYVLRTAAGATQSLTAGNAFANPALVIAGDVAVMVALVAVVIAAAAWRPARYGAVLLAGAIVPMAAQAISALIQAGQAASPLQFGITPGQAARAGLTISSGLTPAFWIYGVFVVALMLTCALMFSTPAPPPPPPARTVPLDATSPAAEAVG
ncbi:MAG TPA: hypothetical protein VMU94_13555 [Streptosporangiaceae bacterium]|nr:hypothetical protein [Streptosporangiaceae bacterium]